MRKVLRVLALCLIPMMLTGCWSYRSLNDISIVMGMSVDKDPITGDFTVVNEIADLSKSIKDSGLGSKRVETKGKTIFEAVRNAKRKMNNRLYFGNMHIIAIGEQTARSDGIAGAVDWIMRDAETRETISLLIAQGSDGKDLLESEGADQPIISLAIDSIVNDDNQVTSSTNQIDLYKAYDILNGQGMNLTLPAFHITDNDGKKVIELNGIAAFKEDKLVGFLPPDESKYFLIATNQCHGGILALASQGTGMPDVSLEIAGSREKTNFTNNGGQISFQIETETDVYLAENINSLDPLDEQQLKALEKEAEKRLEFEINAMIKQVQTEIKSDIFGFGHIIHQRDLKLWRQIKNDWEQRFETLPVSVTCKVNIKNSAYIKSKEEAK